MVYVIGDNDLEAFAVEDLLEMSAAGSSDDVNIIAMVDRHPDYDDADVGPISDFEDTRAVVIESAGSLEAGPGSELNMGHPDTLADFIAGAATAHPADRYALVLWDHGAGWVGMGPDETDGGDILDLAEIDDGIERGLAAAGIDKLDLLGFDACLMATFEVASTVAGHARYLLASEELEPGHGWDYEVLRTIVERPTIEAQDLGAVLIDGYRAHAAVNDNDEDITLSLIDLGRIGDVADALAELSAPLLAEPDRHAASLAQARSSTLAFGANPDPELDPHLVDLGDLADRLGDADPAFAAGADAVTSALSEAVITRVDGPATRAATGLSIYFPVFERHFSQEYLYLPEVRTWPDVLTAYYGAGAAIPADERASFVEETGDAEYFFDEDGLNIFGYFDLAATDTIVGAEIYYGVLDETDDSIIFIGEEPGDVATDGSGLVAAIYDLTVLTISDGEDTDYAYLDLEVDPDSGLLFIDVPLWYVPPEEFDTDDPFHDVILSLIVDSEGTIVSEVYYEIGDDGTFGELDADPDGLIYPIVLNEYPDGSSEWITLSEQGLWANLADLQYELVPLPPGTGLYAELVIFDYGGNIDSVAMFDLIPD